jgi:hypothetical protein
MLPSQTVWATTTFLALLCLTIPPLTKRNDKRHDERNDKLYPGYLRLAYAVYLLSHTIQCILPCSSCTTQKVILGTAGSAYIVVGTGIVNNGGHGRGDVLSREYKRAGAAFVSLAAMQAVLMYADVLPSATLIAYVTGVVVATICVIREVFFIKLGSRAMRRALLFATISGCVDALLPMVVTSATVDVELAARILDSVLYLPMMVWCIGKYEEEDYGEKGEEAVD